MFKPKVVFYSTAGCGGCEEAILDLGEDLFVLAKKAKILFWPIILDSKYKDLERCDIALVNGAIRLKDHEERIKSLREDSKLIVALGSCACFGGIPGLANLRTKEAFLDNLSLNEITNPSMVEDLLERVRPLNQVVKVDYYLPGCPPPANLIKEILSLSIPDWQFKPQIPSPKPKMLCDTCPRKEYKLDRPSIKEIKRIHEIEVDEKTCFLDVGLICLGPATRSGCESRCIKANMPCRGCFGPVSEVRDQGAAFTGALASIIDAKDESEIERIASSIPDMAGTFYRFSIADLQYRNLLNSYE